jgi:hypothetical protein
VAGKRKGEEVSAQKGRAIPNIIVEVLPGESVCGPDEKTYGPGDTFEIEGPSAIALVQAGHVSISGSVKP